MTIGFCQNIVGSPAGNRAGMNAGRSNQTARGCRFFFFSFSTRVVRLI